MKYEKVFAIYTINKYGLAVQSIKGNSEDEAKIRYNKQYPNKDIIDCYETEDKNLIKKAK